MTFEFDTVIKRSLFGAILALLLMPLLQKHIRMFSEKPLFGAFKQESAVSLDSLSWKKWLDGSFQSAVNRQTEQIIGFRPGLVRLYNQLHFSLFKKANAEGVIIGRDGECYEEDYLRAATGAFFIGEEAWKQKAVQMKALSDTLQKLGKHLLVVIEPGKGTVYPENFPSKYISAGFGRGNYQAMLDQFNATGVPVLDLNSAFLRWKDTVAYRLFPKTGTHWSYYGAALAADSLFRRVETLFPGRIAPFKTKALQPAITLRHPDDDIWLTMNLLQKAPVKQIAYPDIVFGQKPEHALCLLTIGDSFYFNWQNEKLILNAFSDSQFWYYNKLIYNHVGGEIGQVKDIDFAKEVLKFDLVLIMITERFHQNFAWGFDTQLYEHFFPGKMSRKAFFENEVRIGNLEFIRIYNEALAANMPLQERLKLEAKFRMFGDWNKHPELYNDKNDVIEMIMMAIKGSPDWYAKVKQKAAERHITDEEMLRLDAAWVYDQKKAKNGS